MPRAYYNEFDKKTAAWLRELIKTGVVADGDVDDRDLKDVCATDLIGYTQHHFFAGIGGWSYALRLAGWPDDRPIWTGSCPCQGFSAAGRQEGFADPRHLWPVWVELLRTYRTLVGESGAPVIAGEQVEQAVRHGWLDLVQRDLEAEGYACGAVVLGAHSVGAPHLRQRLYFVAESLWTRRPEGWAGARDGQAASSGSAGELADAECGSGERRRYDVGRSSSSSESDLREQRLRDDIGAGGAAGAVAHDDRTELERARLAIASRGQCESPNNSPAGDAQGVAKREGLEGYAGDVRNGDESGRVDALAVGSAAEAGDAGGVAESDGGQPGDGGLQRSGRHVQQPENAAVDWSSADWLWCRDEKYRPVEPGTFPLAHGVPARVGRLRGYGNAIVPALAAEFITAYLESRA